MTEQNQYTEIAIAAVFELLSTAAGVSSQALNSQTHLAELSLDSLKLVEIIYELESRFQVTADENLLLELRTVGDLTRLMTHALSEKRP